MKYYDNTRISSYRTCPRKALFRHLFHWASKGKSVNLAFGSAWHTAMDALWTTGLVSAALEAWSEEFAKSGFNPGTSGTLHDLQFDVKHNRQTAAAMLENYAAKRGPFMQQHEVLEVEKPFAVPLTTIPDGPMYVGRLDKVVQDRYKSHIRIIEHKTTSSYDKQNIFRKNFIDSFSPNSQIDGYLYAGALLYPDVFRGVYVDAALVHKTIHNGFQLIPIEKAFELIDLWLYETQLWVQDFQTEMDLLYEHYEYYQSKKFLPIFRRKTEACHNFNGCSYKEVCKFSANPLHLESVPEGFERNPWSPFDELKLEKINLKREEV